MGGQGSGRRWSPDSKSTTGRYLGIDIRWMKKQGFLHPGVIGQLSWTRRGKTIGSNCFGVTSDYLILCYQYSQNDGGEKFIKQIVYFDWTACTYGGRRQWFLCPKCGRRVAIVYGGEQFFCRGCHNLTYASQQESRADRLMRRSRKIRLRLGGGVNLLEPLPCKPKNMHWETYRRLYDKATYAHYFALQIEAEELGIDVDDM